MTVHSPETIAACVARQRKMQRSADQSVLDRCVHFNEIQTGPNPLTEAEIAKLAHRFPERWGMFAKR